MSAVVTIPGTFAGTNTVEVPKANAYESDEDGWLHLRTSTWGGEKVAVFKSWLYVVIEPNRGANGRFVKKG